MKDELKELRKNLRQAIADYMWSEGCSCCRDNDAHEAHKMRLAELLNVPLYGDGSGYNFRKFRSRKRS